MCGFRAFGIALVRRRLSRDGIRAGALDGGAVFRPGTLSPDLTRSIIPEPDPGRRSWGLIRGWIGRPGGDLLSRALRHSTMGAGGFHGRVRDGIGWALPAMATRSSNPSLGPVSGFPGRISVVRIWCCVCVWRVVWRGDLGMISMHGVGFCVSSRSGD
jgi:hypothetical protein